MTGSARVATVILNYKSAEDTLRAVTAVRRSTVLDQRLIVVDNGPHDSSHEDLSALLGQGVETLATGANLGYAGGNNVGIRHALAHRPEFVWLLNPDTEVEPTTLERLLGAAEEVPDAGTLGPRILFPDRRRIWFDGGVIDAERGGAPSHLHAGLSADDVPADGPRDADYVTGASLLVRREVFGRVGLLPEEWFLYFEETDFCRRVAAAGWRNIVDPRARMVHHQRSSGMVPTPYYLYYMTRNRMRFASKQFGASEPAVLPYFRETFLDPWRAKVERFAPAWLVTFDELVQAALADARAGVTGWSPMPDAVPKPDLDSPGRPEGSP
jgi:GT2 family glycosyltransferase